jgi:D-alanyl-D-alanine carboxypeptidase (penicillin-binding protein 5/6)
VSGTGDEYRDLAEMFERSQVETYRPDPNDPVIAHKRKRRRRGRLIAAGVVLALFGGAIGTYLPLTLLAPVAATPAGFAEPVVEVPAALAFPSMPALATAVSVTGAEAEFPATAGVDGILGATGGNEARPIASISKVVTALVILAAKPLEAGQAGPTLNFGKAENDTYDKYYVLGATIAPMKIGSSMSQHDALSMMLMVSASNYAEVTSTWALGSQANVRNATKKWLADNGLTGTTMVEPTGIDPRNVSTPSDLIKIARLAMANPVVAEIVGTKNAQLGSLGMQTNRNGVLGVDGINGIKTGTLDEAGSCLLFSAVTDVGLDAPVTIVGVVLGSANSSSAGDVARTMIATIRSGFHNVPLVGSGDQLGEYFTPWKDSAQIVAGEGATVLTWSDTPITVTSTVEPVGIAKDGTKVGSITFTAGARTATVPLELDGAINGPGGWWRVTHPRELLFEQ